MKNKLYISLIAACAVGLSSCERDIDNYMVDDTVGLLRPGLVEAEVYEGLDDPYSVYAIKAGKGFQNANLSISVDNTVIDEYNAANNTSLSAVPSDCYSVTVSDLEMSKEDYRKPFLISWDRTKLADALAQDPNIVIPLRLTVDENTGVNIDETRLTTLIKPTMEKPYIEFEHAGQYTGIMPTRADEERTIVYMNVVSSFIAQQDIEYEFEILSQDEIDEYNAANGTDYIVLPENAYSIERNWTLKKYMKSSRFNFMYYKSALMPENEPTAFGNYVLPIRIKSVSSSQINPDKNTMLYVIKLTASEFDKAYWTVVDCNSSVLDDPDANTAATYAECGPEKLIDGSTSTIWRSIWSNPTEMPYYVTFDLGATRTVYKAAFTNPAGANISLRNVKQVQIALSNDGENWTVAGTGDVSRQTVASLEFDVTPTSGRYMRFIVTDAWTYTGDGARIAIAEIKAWGE